MNWNASIVGKLSFVSDDSYRICTNCYKQMQLYMAILNTQMAYVCFAIAENPLMIKVCGDAEFLKSSTEAAQRWMRRESEDHRDTGSEPHHWAT